MIEPTWTQIAAMGYEIPGIGVIGGDVVASILSKFDTRIARVLLDERTGVVIETGVAQYLPNPAMRRFIQQRDGTCRFPGAGVTRGAANPTTSPLLPRRTHRHLEPDQPVQTPPPGQTQRRLGADHEQGRRLHLDRPPRPPVRHPPHQPPRARRLK